MMRKNIEIVNPKSERILVASLSFKNMPNDKKISWKKKVYSKEDVGNIASRILFAVEDDGEVLLQGDQVSYTYKFSDKEKDKYVKLYAYVESFKEQPQAVVFYVEEVLNTALRIRKAELVGSSEEVKVHAGELLKLRTVYSIEDKKVPSNTKKNVKWMVKIDGEEERLIIDGEVIRGGEVEFVAPLEWEFKNVVLMPYLYKHTEDVSCEVYIEEKREILEFYWTDKDKNKIEDLPSDGEVAYLYIKTKGYSEGETIAIELEDDEKEFAPGQNKKKLEGEINEEGEAWFEAYNLKR